MRYLILSLCCTGVLACCQSHKAVEEKPAALTATLPPVDTEKNQACLINTMWVASL